MNSEFSWQLLREVDFNSSRSESLAETKGAKKELNVAKKSNGVVKESLMIAFGR